MTKITDIYDYFSGEVAEQLEKIKQVEAIQNESPEVLAKLKPIELAKFLANGSDLEKSNAVDLAKAFIDQLIEMGYGHGPDESTVLPQEITIKTEESLESKTLKEKLYHGISNPEDAWEVLTCVSEDISYSKASKKATQALGAALVIAWNGATINVDETIGYINFLGQEYSEPQSEWSGLELTTLKNALHIREVERVHPLQNKIIVGPDSVGHDYLPLEDVDPELWDSIVWARLTNNALFPSDVDLYEHGAEILGHMDIRLKQDSRWERIRKAYCAAKKASKAKSDLRLDVESVKKPQGSQGVTKNQSTEQNISSEALSESAYKALVLSNIDSVQRNATASGNRPEIKGAAINVNLSGNRPYIQALVLGGGDISGNRPYGTVYIPEWSMQPRISGNRPDVNVVKISWKKAAEILGLQVV